jgi:beta-lactamase regulating signal transducer with metallopeptidase domain
MTALVIEAALRSLLLAVAVWTALEVFRVRNVLAAKTAWILVLAAAVVMPLMLVLAARFPGLPVPRLVLPAIAAHAPTHAAALTSARAAAKSAPSQAGLASAASARPVLGRPAGAEPSAPRNGNAFASSRAEDASGNRSPYLSKPLDPAGLGLTGADPARADLPGTDRSGQISEQVPAQIPAQIPAGIGTAPSVQNSTPSPNPLSLAAFAALLYLLVAFALCLRLLLGLAVTWRVWRAADPVPALTLDTAAGLSLRASDQISTPVTIGSGVLLPAEYSGWGEEKLRMVLAHERSHVRQGDFYLQLLASLYAALLWLSPLGWWLKRKLSDLGEAIGDRSGLEAAQSRTAYARVLLEFAAAPRPTVLGVAMARPSSLSRRMERLLNDSAFRQAFSSRGRAFAAALLLPVLFFAAAALVRVEAASDSTQATSATQRAQFAAKAQAAQAMARAEAARQAADQAADQEVQISDQATQASDRATQDSDRAAAAAAQAEAQATAAGQQANSDAAAEAAPLVRPAPFDAPVIRMQISDGQLLRVPDGVRTVILADPAGNGSYTFSNTGETLALLAGGRPRVQSGDAVASAAFDRTLSFNGNLELHLATGCGNIHLTRGSAGQLVVHGDVTSSQAEEADEVRSIAANPPIEQQGNIIRIGRQHDEGDRHNHICIAYEVQAPADAALEAISGSGDIVDEGVGHGAKLQTGSGNINATGLEGGFTTQTGSGNIGIENSGDGDGKAQTGSGNIEVQAVHGALRAQTGSGDIKVTGTPSSPWKLETGSGSVEFSPGSAGLTLDASTGSGSVKSDHPMALQVSSDGHHVSGQLNGGGPDVRIETGSGDIHIHD